jgi:hypothetical protein
MLRIQVVRDDHLIKNKLFQGRDWSTARVSIKAATGVKVCSSNTLPRKYLCRFN